MHFSIREVEYEHGKKTEIIHFEVDEGIRLSALEIAKKKAPYTMKWSVSDFERDQRRQLNNLWQGKIADKKAMQWLVSMGFQIEEYDEIRTDNFKYPDPWDLRVTTSNLVEISGVKFFGKTQGTNNIKRLRDYLPKEFIPIIKGLKVGQFIKVYGDQITLIQTKPFYQDKSPIEYKPKVQEEEVTVNAEPQRPKRKSLLEKLLGVCL